MGFQRYSLFLAGLATHGLSVPAWSQEAAPTDPIDLSGEWTQFVGSAVAGSGDFTPRYGGRVDAYANIDGEAIGLWSGLSFKMHGEFVYGENVNRVGSMVLLPVNSGLNFPDSGVEAADFSFSVVQRIGRVRIQAGKINFFDQSSGVPIVAGGGKEGFQHSGIAAPPSLIGTSKVMGAVVTVPVGRLILTGGVWSPDDWTMRYDLKRFFEDGVDVMAVALLPAKIGGLQGFHNVSITATTRKRIDPSEPDLQFPPFLANLPAPPSGGVFVKYGVQQFLWQDPANPRRNWGIFGHAGVSRGTPEVIGWSMTAGIASNGPFQSRPKDRFGLGYFRMGLSDSFVRGLAPHFALKDEQGAELYYTLEMVPNVRVTGNMQLVDSAFRDAPTALYAGLRVKLAVP